MSCYVLPRENTHTLVDAAHRYLRLRRPGSSEFSVYTPLQDPSTAGTVKRSTYDYTDESMNKLGAMLEAENVRSYRCRYGGDTPTDASLAMADPYVYRVPKKQHSAIELLKIIHCYEYQSCESTDWEFTEAQAFCRTLEREIICSLPGYSEAPWGVEDP